MRYLLTVFAFFLVLLPSCNDNEKDYSSIIGEWIVEDNGEVTYYKRYEVSIQRAPYDTSLFIIRNFYRLGLNSEVYASVNDKTLTISNQIVNDYSITGTGTVSDNYKEIDLNYQVTGGTVGQEAVESYYHRE